MDNVQDRTYCECLRHGELTIARRIGDPTHWFYVESDHYNLWSLGAYMKMLMTAF